MKELYSFVVNQRKEVEVSKETEAGTLISKEIQNVPVNVILKKPSRKEVEEADTVWAVEFSDAVKKGIVTKAMLAKYYNDAGGFISKKESEEYLEMLERSSSLQSEYKLAQLKTNPDEEKLKDISLRLTEFFYKIQQFESRQSQIFDQTAEVRARNKTIQWLVINLTHTEVDEAYHPFFSGQKQEAREDFYYNVLEGDDVFALQIVEKAALFLTFWYMGRATSKEDFATLEKELEAADEGVEEKL